MNVEKLVEDVVQKVAKLNGCIGTTHYWGPYETGNNTENYRVRVLFEFRDPARSWPLYFQGFNRLNLAQNFRDYFPASCHAAGIKLSPSSEPAKGATCGGAQVLIRARHPGEGKRTVCPTCMADTLDDLRDRLNGPTTAKDSQ